MRSTVPLTMRTMSACIFDGSIVNCGSDFGMSFTISGSIGRESAAAARRRDSSSPEISGSNDEIVVVFMRLLCGRLGFAVVRMLGRLRSWDVLLGIGRRVFHAAVFAFERLHVGQHVHFHPAVHAMEGCCFRLTFLAHL